MRYSRSNAYKSTKISTPEEDSGHSSASNSPPAQCSPNNTMNSNLSKNIQELNNNINLSTVDIEKRSYELSAKSEIIDETATNDSGRAPSDFDTTSTVDSGSSRYSTFSSESFSMSNYMSNDCIEKNDTNHIMISGSTNTQKIDNFNNENIVAVNLEKCIITN